MQCPICRKVVIPEGNPYRPFCSERCKLIDLDHWLSGRYRIAAPLSSAEGTNEDAGNVEPASEESLD